MIFLTSISPRESFSEFSHFPFKVPVISNLSEIMFSTPVTFLVGENGSGKSTLLEAIAAGVGSPTIGGESILNDSSLTPARELADKLRLAWKKRTRRGFFLRAEDFFNFSKLVSKSQAELQEIADHYDKTLSGSGRQRAMGVTLGQKEALIQSYGENLDANSHGESFLKLFKARLKPEGLYLLDEPEAPLSPQRQIAFLSMIKDMINQNSQFIIATHSPILMAFPGATIFSCDEIPVKKKAFNDVEHVQIMKSFLNNPENYLRRL